MSSEICFQLGSSEKGTHFTARCRVHTTNKVSSSSSSYFSSCVSLSPQIVFTSPNLICICGILQKKPKRNQILFNRGSIPFTDAAWSKRPVFCIIKKTSLLQAQLSVSGTYSRQHAAAQRLVLTQVWCPASFGYDTQRPAWCLMFHTSAWHKETHFRAIHTVHKTDYHLRRGNYILYSALWSF